MGRSTQAGSVARPGPAASAAPDRSDDREPRPSVNEAPASAVAFKTALRDVAVTPRLYRENGRDRDPFGSEGVAAPIRGR